MSSDGEDTPELVDDYYWLRRAGELITANSNLRSDAAKQLMVALSWLWSVYTGAAILGAHLKHLETGSAVAILIAAPSLVIVVAYAAAVYAYMPLVVEFDPRDPAEVRTAYTDGVERGWRRLRFALALAAVAGVSIAAAIVATVSAK